MTTKAVVPLVLLLGCGPASLPTPDLAVSGTDDLSVVDSAVDASAAPDLISGDDGPVLDTRCPASAPTTGAPCFVVGLQCEYGDDYSQACDVIATCNLGAWRATSPGASCPSPIPGIAPGCPASLAAVPLGAACSPALLTCGYPEGRCVCANDHSGVHPAWGCFPSKNCPYPRPRLGSDCTVQGQTCDYSLCGNSLVCLGGMWRRGSGGCHP